MSVLVQTTAFPSSPFHLPSLSTLSAQAWFFPIVHWDRGKIFVSCPCLFVFHYIKRTSDFSRLSDKLDILYSFLWQLNGSESLFTAIYFIKDKTHSAFVWFLVKKKLPQGAKGKQGNSNRDVYTNIWRQLGSFPPTVTN